MMVLLLVTGLFSMVIAGITAFYLGSSMMMSLALGVVAANLAVAVVAGVVWALGHLRTKASRRSAKGVPDRDGGNIGHLID